MTIGSAREFARTLVISAGFLSLAVHAATFVWLVPFWPILVIIGLLFVAAVCAGRKTAAPRLKRTETGADSNWGWIVLAVAAYATWGFVVFYQRTGGATSAALIDGHYAYLYKSHIIRFISETEYRTFPNSAVRTLSAWCAVMAGLGYRNNR